MQEIAYFSLKNIFYHLSIQISLRIALKFAYVAIFSYLCTLKY